MRFLLGNIRTTLIYESLYFIYQGPWGAMLHVYSLLV
jgi:hypothetical protein